MDTQHSSSGSKREALLHKVERLTELPLLVLSFAMIPLLVGPFFWNLSATEESVFLALDTFIWALFAVDLLVKLVIVPRRGTYIKRHWLEILVVVVPFFRPLRIVRIFLFGSRAWRGTRRLVNVDFIIVYGIGLIIIAATLVTTFESNTDSTIQSFPDALWWAMVTITTVGYGDMVPVTVAGRAVAFVLMLGGIAFFSGITANLASFMVKGGGDSDKKLMEELTEETQDLKKEISKLNQSKSSAD